jgi:hypothetical protein
MPKILVKRSGESLISVKDRVGSENAVRVLTSSASAPSKLSLLNDVDSTFTNDGSVIVYDAPSNKFTITDTIHGPIKFTNIAQSISPSTGALIVSGGIGIGGNLNVAGVSTFSGEVTFGSGSLNLGDSDSDNINVSGEFVSNLVPNETNLYNLGTNVKKWRNLFISGITSTNNLYVVGVSTFTNTLNITGVLNANQGLYYDTDDFDGPNGIAYFNDSGKLISATSSTTEIITESNLILTTNSSGVPKWSSVIDGGTF